MSMRGVILDVAAELVEVKANRPVAGRVELDRSDRVRAGRPLDHLLHPWLACLRPRVDGGSRMGVAEAQLGEGARPRQGSAVLREVVGGDDEVGPVVLADRGRRVRHVVLAIVVVPLGPEHRASIVGAVLAARAGRAGVVARRGTGVLACCVAGACIAARGDRRLRSAAGLRRLAAHDAPLTVWGVWPTQCESGDPAVGFRRVEHEVVAGTGSGPRPAGCEGAGVEGRAGACRVRGVRDGCRVGGGGVVRVAVGTGAGWSSCCRRGSSTDARSGHCAGHKSLRFDMTNLSQRALDANLRGPPPRGRAIAVSAGARAHALRESGEGETRGWRRRGEEHPREAAEISVGDAARLTSGGRTVTPGGGATAVPSVAPKARSSSPHLPRSDTSLSSRSFRSGLQMGHPQVECPPDVAQWQRCGTGPPRARAKIGSALEKASGRTSASTKRCPHLLNPAPMRGA